MTTNTKPKTIPQQNQSDSHMADVLYQRLGNEWYAFAELNGELYISKVEENQIQAKIEEQEDFFVEAMADLEEIQKKSPKAA